MVLICENKRIKSREITFLTGLKRLFFSFETMYTSDHLQALYSSFCNTSLLWSETNILELHQLDVINGNSIFRRKLKRSLRLGQLVEQFVFNQIESSSNFEIIAENIQIQNGKQTKGELDAIIRYHEDTVHLEIIYKFYLYDDSLGTSETDKWIGPNRNDSLNQKLRKLKEKQLPLLHSTECKKALQPYHLQPRNIHQKVLFKAQLFTPYLKTIKFNLLNKNCVSGFYMTKNQLKEFKNHAFYLPSKIDWLLQPHLDVYWLDMETFIIDSETFLSQKKSPLFWLKSSTNALFKCFLVWW